jgi:hypothetical protein
MAGCGWEVRRVEGSQGLGGDRQHVEEYDSQGLA